MKHLKVIILIAVAVLISGITAVAAESQPALGNKAAAPDSSAVSVTPEKSETTSADKVIAYYFYTTKRCPSCKKIEAFSREAIDSGFAAELKNNLLEFRPLNIDEDSNKHFIEDYQLYTKSLVVVNFKDNKQVEWKNLTKVWELLNDKEAFIKYVRDEVTACLPEK